MGRAAGLVCLVTGGGMGLGETAARSLAREGGRVAICDVDADAGRATAASIGDAAFFLGHDVRDEAAWIAAIAKVVERWGRLDVLVNNAGIVELGDIETCTLESWRRVHEVSLTGTFLGCKHAIPVMRGGGGGAIVNMASTAALLGMPAIPAYSAAKGGIVALTRAVAAHCLAKGDRIRCNAIAPGTIETPAVRAIYDHALGHLPQQERVVPSVGSPQDVANAVLYLASSESAMMTGTMLVLDGGLSIIEPQLPAPSR
ncbi:MAG: SDR family oxidoreductase [Candidimonas sp.]